VPFDTDGSFSWERFEERYTSDLANSLGNLASRATAMVEKYFDGVVPSAEPTDLDARDARDVSAYHTAMSGTQGFLLHEGLAHAMAAVSRGNEYIQSTQPWALAKVPSSRPDLERVLAAVIRQLARTAMLLSPFMPNKAEELWRHVGGPGSVHDTRFGDPNATQVGGWRVTKDAPLFPKPAA